MTTTPMTKAPTKQKQDCKTTGLPVSSLAGSPCCLGIGENPWLTHRHTKVSAKELTKDERRIECPRQQHSNLAAMSCLLMLMLEICQRAMDT